MPEDASNSRQFAPNLRELAARLEGVACKLRSVDGGILPHDNLDMPEWDKAWTEAWANYARKGHT